MIASRAKRAAAVVAVLWLSPLVASTLAGGCALSRVGTQQQQCSDVSECDDGNPCTDDACDTSGTCLNEPVADYVVEQQVTADCQRVECIAGELTQVNDDADINVDDNECTSDECVDGTPVNDPLPAGDPCTDGNEHTGECDGDGACEVECNSDNAATVCDDGEVCTDDSCDLTSGKCVNAPLDGVAAVEAQDVGDCQLIVCQSGNSTSQNDNTDLPFDDNQCTSDECSNGVVLHDPLAIGSACDEDGGRVCNGDDNVPACVDCNGPSDCTDLPADDDCNTRTCVNNACAPDHAPKGTPVNEGLQTSGDCQLQVCDGFGGTEQNVDDGDLPFDGKDCTQDLCDGGVSSNPPEPADSACGVNGDLFCDGAGECKDCTVAAQCGTDTFCKVWACNGGSCEDTDTDSGTALPAEDQVDNDCLIKQCDTAGIEEEVPDDSDKPVDDGNPCTQNECNNGAQVFPDEDLDTPCDDGMGGAFCDANGTCVECNNDGQCDGGPPDCQVDACDAGNVCVFEDTPMGDPAPDGQQTDFDCQLVVCDGMGAVDPVSVDQDTDLPFDDNQCTDDICSMGVPSNPEKAAETTCDEGGVVCNGDPSDPDCVECATDTQCMAPAVCDTSVWMCCTPMTCGDLGKTCGTHADGCGGMADCNGAQNGDETGVDCGGDANACATRCPDGDPCAVGADCANTFCAEGTCCDEACGGDCRECSTGACTDVVHDAQDPGTCDGAGEACDGNGNCLSADGEVCAAGGECASGECHDTTCCDTDCSGTCVECSTGTCSNVAEDAQDPMTCDMTGDACDGAGNCLLADGETCADGAECASGECHDTTCCDADCSGTCVECSTGTCINVAEDAQDPMTCDMAGDACDGAGNCLLADGETCAAGGECASGECHDTTCCDVDCSGTCLECSTGTCANVPSDTQDPMTCDMAGDACDGAGNCLLADGETCAAGGECASGECHDATCCDVDCSGTCVECSTGTCTNVAEDVQDPMTCDMAGDACDGAGNCLLADGETCAAGGECVSGECHDATCCDTDCSGTCVECSTGTCTNVAEDVQDPMTCEMAGDACNGMGECKLADGEACMMGDECASAVCADDVCCDMACNGTCVECSTGSCIDVAEDVQDPMTCDMAGEACDGAGGCLLADGETCAVDDDCAGGNCPADDAVCCDVACGDVCEECSSGTCAFEDAFADDDNDCMAGSACDGAGACKLENGEACAAGSDCISGICNAMMMCEAA